MLRLDDDDHYRCVEEDIAAADVAAAADEERRKPMTLPRRLLRRQPKLLSWLLREMTPCSFAEVFCGGQPVVPSSCRCSSSLHWRFENVNYLLSYQKSSMTMNQAMCGERSKGYRMYQPQLTALDTICASLLGESECMCGARQKIIATLF